MDQASGWLLEVKATLLSQLADVVAYLPNLLGALLLLLAGWLLGRLLRSTAVRLGDAANRLLDPLMPTGRLAQLRFTGHGTRLVGDLIFALVLFLFVIAAAKVAELDTVSAWLASIVAYLPYLFGGGLIVLIGYVLSATVRDLITTTLTSMGAGHAELIGAVAQWATLMTALIIGINLTADALAKALGIDRAQKAPV